jgi:hypothetical protein
MRTTLTIECDIQNAQEILYSASKIIQKAEDIRTGLDKLHRLAGKIDRVLEGGINVYQFMELDDEYKKDYICQDGGGLQSYIKLYNSNKTDMSCQGCGVGVNTSRTLIGTPDISEPMYCYVHFCEINPSSRFIKKGDIINAEASQHKDAQGTETKI